jgi:hypothetical protein
MPYRGPSDRLSSGDFPARTFCPRARSSPWPWSGEGVVPAAWSEQLSNRTQDQVFGPSRTEGLALWSIEEHRAQSAGLNSQSAAPVRAGLSFLVTLPGHQGSSTSSGRRLSNGCSASNELLPRFSGATLQLGRVTRGSDRTDPSQSIATRCNSVGRNWSLIRTGNASTI